MKPVTAVITAALLSAALSGPAVAQEAYGAVMGNYALPHSGDADLLVSILGGVVSTGMPFAAGVEAEYGLALGSGSEFDTRRLRGVARYDLGTLTAFGALGLDQFVSETVTDSGYSIGLGGEVDLQGNLALRGEMIRTFITDGATADTTTTRAGIVYKF